MLTLENAASYFVFCVSVLSCERVGGYRSAVVTILVTALGGGDLCTLARRRLRSSHMHTREMYVGAQL